MALNNRRTILNGIISDLYETGDTSTAHKALTELYGKNYQKAVDGVFKKPVVGSVEWEKAQQFKINVEHFAAAKANRLLGEIAEKCTGTEDEYKEAAKQLVNKYNSYQGPEYNTLMARARSSKQLLQFAETAHIYPNVEWIMTRSANPREEHLIYVGRIFALEDEFLQANLPGSLYGCKCDLKQTREPVTDPPAKTVTPSKGLEGNPNNTGELITYNHPYFNLPAADRAVLDRTTSKYIRDENRHWGHDNLVGKHVKTSINGEETNVLFTSSGIKHIINDPFDKERYNFKNMLIPYLPELLKISKFVRSAPSVKPNPMIKMFHYLEVEFLGKPAYLNVRELVNGEHVLYAITDSIK